MDRIQLVKLCQAGDREAFGILYQTYFHRLRKVVTYYVHDESAATDILHDGFLIVFSSIGNLENLASIESWLITIMKNLSLQYLKDESFRLSISDTSISENINDNSDDTGKLTWEELDKIINRLPAGYNTIFRLAVLDGLSHKEIGNMLGIAPHSSSSQLSRAKTMLRRLISEYRTGIGIFSIVSVLLIVWNGIFNHSKKDSDASVISRNADEKIPDVEIPMHNSSIRPNSMKSKVTYKTITDNRLNENIAEAPVQKDNAPTTDNDSVCVDTIRPFPNMTDHRKGVISLDNTPHLRPSETSGWSLALAYTGNIGQDGSNRYTIPNPDISDSECPSGEIEVTEKAHHHIPFVIGLSVNKALSSRWSIESGVRYTFLRTDLISESRLINKNTIQRIHYIGVPVKFNYRMFTYDRLSVYGQGGVTMDIPVKGSQDIQEYYPGLTYSKTDRHNIHAPLQWSLDGGVGIQYRFTPSFSIYAEPSFRYYFNPGSDIKTIRQANPFEFTIPVGLRITW